MQYKVGDIIKGMASSNGTYVYTNSSMTKGKVVDSKQCGACTCIEIEIMEHTDKSLIGRTLLAKKPDDHFALIDKTITATFDLSPVSADIKN